jgi:hypothetical protein
MCTPFSISASVTAADGLADGGPVAGDVDDLAEGGPNCGVFAGQWVPLGP